ncbi:hypothetical protein Peur_019278 [Populus x canadensis]
MLGSRTIESKSFRSRTTRSRMLRWRTTKSSTIKSRTIRSSTITSRVIVSRTTGFSTARLSMLELRTLRSSTTRWVKQKAKINSSTKDIVLSKKMSIMDHSSIDKLQNFTSKIMSHRGLLRGIPRTINNVSKADHGWG